MLLFLNMINIFKKLLSKDCDSGIFRQIPLNVPGKLYTSPMPFGAYDHGSRLLDIYKRNKIEHVFLLVTDVELKKKARRDLLKYYARNNISYSRYVIKDLQTPSFEIISFLIIEVIKRLKKQRVVIHCHAGVGRTAVSVCCIVIAVKGDTAEKAIEYVCKNMAVDITSEQKNLIKEFELKFMKPIGNNFQISNS